VELLKFRILLHPPPAIEERPAGG